MPSHGMSSFRSPKSAETSSASGVDEGTHPCRLLTYAMGKHALLPNMVRTRQKSSALWEDNRQSRHQ
eukprot:2457099-Lingulodinium_polyedra.AAC.1